MNERLDRFSALLKQIFELDKSDLDFGIYRVMNLRKAEIEKFLTDRLPQMVRETLAPFAQDSREKIRAQMAEIEKSAAAMGLSAEALPESAPTGQKYRALQKALTEGADLTALETDVYSALYTFFSRYYEDGDFISKRRYKEGVYAIPYEGEEVKLYWANQDQYYIKTSENFKDYTFVFDGITVHFRLVDATTEQNNNQESRDSKRVFMLFQEDEERHPGLKTFEYDAAAGEIVIRFVYDIPADKKKRYTEENYAAITNWLLSLRRAELNPLLTPIPIGKGKEITTPLEKHLKGYVAKNTFDYFIHKDLRGFLSRELDLYIKSEIMHLEDLDTSDETRAETYLAKLKAIKRVGAVIIDFLAQIEDFQKKLWLKKKFVVETNWCVTLDKIGEDFWPEIAKNTAQIQEWTAMYAIDEAEGWSDPPTVEFLRQNQNLPVDTAHFSGAFKDALLESIGDLDAQTSGVLLHSDNYQALRLLLERYRGRVQLTYIDPPYNTDASKILYKNGYEHSSWLSLMESRLAEGRELMCETGVIEAAIDDYEMRYLNTCMDQVFGSGNAISNIAILTNPKGRDQGFIAQAHDYTLIYARNKALAATNNFVLSEEALAKKFAKSKDGAALRELPLKRTGTGKFREERPYMYFPFFYSKEKDELLVIPEDLYRQIYDAATDSFDDLFLDRVIASYAADGYTAILPLSSKGEKYRWRWGYKSCAAGVKNGALFCKAVKGGGYAVYQYDFADEEATPKSLWFGERYDASSKGTNLLEQIIPGNPFDYPKSLYTVEDNLIIGSSAGDIVLDYFAGSGTTGHAVVDLNRRTEDPPRKYILADMGEHFNSVLLPRMKKVVYAPDWKNGRPQSRGDGISQIIKYMRLESYEDALSNIQLSDNGGQLASLLGEEYLIHYMVDLESQDSLLDVDAFSNPFAYTMKITEKNVCQERPVDLCETFNYLIGLTVIRQTAVSCYLSKPAEAPAYEGAVELVRDTSGPYAFRRIEGTLPDGRRALVIWRTVTDDILASNAALDAYFTACRKSAGVHDCDVIFVNGDSNLENLRIGSESWKVQMTETEFKKRMFEEM
ncbi:site-specific DNA-methyltransferase [uncultured Dysosmobacter sp.]|uniref:site-specific DNA-methyltransferase n=1 Tax=uncultured Dysosmobacter sp. TaxID=2591384 RepID=UPI0026274306|nr:site-specific DNA-methyltransferase [uncultured Dysosmobacter sp.]